MVEVILSYGPYEFDGIIKYRIFRLLGLMRLLAAADIPFKLYQIPHWDRLYVEIEGHSVYMSRLTNMGCVGDDYNNITAFEIIKEAYESVKRYYLRKDENSLLYQKNTGEKCFPITFDSFYLESFSDYKRVEEICIEPEREIGEEFEEEGEISKEESESTTEESETASEESKPTTDESDITSGDIESVMEESVDEIQEEEEEERQEEEKIQEEGERRI